MPEPSTDLPCLILEMEDAHAWERATWCGAVRIPLVRRPSMLQTNREQAEAEALRLAREHPPGRRFVVFQPVCAGITAKVPTHCEPALVTIDDPNEVPF